MGITDIDNTIRDVIKGGKETGKQFGSGFKSSFDTNVPKPNITPPNEVINAIKQALSKFPIEGAYGEVTIKFKGLEPKTLRFRLE